MANIWLDFSFFRNDKTKMLKKLIGHEGIICLLKLWLYAGENFEDGSLKGKTAERIELIADWGGVDGEFINACTKAGFMHGEGDDFALTNFIDNNGSLYKKMIRREAGKKGGRPKANANQTESKAKANDKQTPKNEKSGKPNSTQLNSTQLNSTEQNKEINTLSGKPDGASPSSKKNGNKWSSERKEIIDDLNATCDKKYRYTSKKTNGLIDARLNDGYTVVDFKDVHRKKSGKWKTDPEMNLFLRPSTLYGTKFESYLNEKEAGPSCSGGMNIKQTQKYLSDMKKG